MTTASEAVAPVPPVPRLANRARLARELGLVVAGQAGVAVVGLVGLRILTTLLVPSEFGRLALGLSIATLFAQVAFGPIAVATLRFAGRAFDEGQLAALLRDVDRLLAQATLLSAALTIVVGLVVAYFHLSDWLLLGVLCLWFASASGVLGSGLAVDASLRRRGWVAGMQVGSEAARFAGAAVVLLLVAARSAPAAMGGFALATSLSALVQRTRRRKDPSPHEASDVNAGSRRADLLAFAKPLAVTGGLTWSQMASDRWSLNAMISTTQVGVYSVVYQIGVAPFTLLGSTIQQLLGPVVFQIAGAGTDRAAVRASHLYVLKAVAALITVTTVCALVSWRFHDRIFALLVGPKFAQYSALLPLGVIAGGLMASAQVVATTVMSRGDTSRLVLPKAVTAVLGAALNIAGAHFYGVKGVLAANVVFSIIFFAWMSATASGPGGSQMSDARETGLRAEAAPGLADAPVTLID